MDQFIIATAEENDGQYSLTFSMDAGAVYSFLEEGPKNLPVIKGFAFKVYPTLGFEIVGGANVYDSANLSWLIQNDSLLKTASAVERAKNIFISAVSNADITSDQVDGTVALIKLTFELNEGFTGPIEFVIEDTDIYLENETITQADFTLQPHVNPQIVSSPTLTILQDETYAYTLSAVDRDSGDNFSTVIINAPDWLTFDQLSNTLSGTPDNDDVGDHEVVLSVTDTDGLIDNQSYIITVANVNDAPQVIASEKTNAIPNRTYEQNISVVDIDVGDELESSFSNLPDWLTFDPAAMSLTGTPTVDDIGEYNLAFSTNDIAGEIDTQRFQISVGADAIIWEENSEIELTANFEVPADQVLIIEEGVSVKGNGFSLIIAGTLHTKGSTNNPIEVNNLSVLASASSARDTPAHINIQHTNFSNGSFLTTSGYFTLNISDSQFLNVNQGSQFYLWYPEADVSIKRSIFKDSGHFEVLTRGKDIVFENNLFSGQKGIVVLAVYEEGDVAVVNNSFLGSEIALEVPKGYDTAIFGIVKDNYFGTIDLDDIQRRILDGKDTIERAFEIDLGTILDEPHPNTPTPIFAQGKVSVWFDSEQEVNIAQYTVYTAGENHQLLATSSGLLDLSNYLFAEVRLSTKVQGGINEAVDLLDVLKLLDHISGNITLTGGAFVAGDIVDNGDIDLIDALGILEIISSETDATLVLTDDTYSRDITVLNDTMELEAIVLGDVIGNFVDIL